ncbi:MAG: magnesium transporter [Candidatus Woesearchaeota archaeon]|nr:magnesium transporter [Candidatus Woesearchaeota archaeon]
MAKKYRHNDFTYRLLLSPEKRMAVFNEIPINKRGFILLGLPRRIQQEIVINTPDKELIPLLHYLDPDETTDIIQNMRDYRSHRILQALNDDIKEKVEFLLRFNPRTAAGLMSLNYVQVELNSRFRDVYGIIKRYEKRNQKFPTLLVVKDGYCVGTLQGHLVVLHRGNEKITRYIKKVPTIRYDSDETGVIKLFKKYRNNKVVVLDHDNSILGLIYSEDVLRLIEKQPARNLYEFAGVTQEESVLDSAFMKVKQRYQWLILNLATAFLAAYVVSLFAETISSFVLLAVYMPIVAGMGGNAGTQTLAVVVRGLALKEIHMQTARPVIINEVTAGAINGLINGVIVAIVATLWNKNPLLGLIIGISMVINLVVAGFFGTIIPLIMKKMGKDPAASATIFITTATDVFGFLTFLGLATLIL